MSAWWEKEFIQEQVEAVELIDTILTEYKDIIKVDYFPYRNHCQRVFRYYVYLLPKEKVNVLEALKKGAIAVAFHDIGIWTSNTLAYLDPSSALAKEYLEKNNLESWTGEICQMIEDHHKLLQGDLPSDGLVETFRRADFVDFNWGWLTTHGIPYNLTYQTQGIYPNEGFHYRLFQLALDWFPSHPLNPAPMLKW